MATCGGGAVLVLCGMSACSLALPSANTLRLRLAQAWDGCATTCACLIYCRADRGDSDDTGLCEGCLGTGCGMPCGVSIMLCIISSLHCPVDV